MTACEICFMVGALHPSWSGQTLTQSSDRASETARLRCEMRRQQHAHAHASRRHLFRVHTIRGIHANRTDTRGSRTQTENSPRNDSPSLHLEIFIFNRNRRHSNVPRPHKRGPFTSHSTQIGTCPSGVEPCFGTPHRLPAEREESRQSLCEFCKCFIAAVDPRASNRNLSGNRRVSGFEE